MTWLHMARRIASEFGLALNDRDADYLLWEETGFPEFFIGDPVATCANQLRSAFRRRGHRRIYPMHAYSATRHAARAETS